MKRKKEIYISSKSLVDQNRLYSLDKGVAVLPWKIEEVKYIVKGLDLEVRAFCYRDQKDELLILDSRGVVWRYHIGIERLQKTPLVLDEAIDIDVVGEIAVVRYIDHRECYFLANGQRLSCDHYEVSLVESDWMGRVWNLEDGVLSYLSPSRRYKIPLKPILLSIDSLEYNSRWHRVVLDYETPAECDIRIEVVASNKREFPKDDSSFEPVVNLTRDTLLPDNIEGQYLFLKIYLIPDQRRENSPQLKSIRLIYPRSTYLDHLPAFYQEDRASAPMLERFFSIFETTLSKLEQKRANTPSLIDTKETSDEDLAWLSSWLGLNYDEHWSNERWRELLREAPRLFDIRGTRESIERVIEIYSGMRPLIQEPMHQRCRESTTLDSYSFCVFLRPEQHNSIDEVKTIRRIVEEWKPAYTKAEVIPLEHHTILGSYLFLEVNTKLTKRATHLGESRLPFIELSPAREGDMRRVEQVSIEDDAILH